ncbi:MAG TPA: hypothetical protein VFI91_11855 [Longimicrobiaceae bacterium]|nr:hypothetical protein [Longimicrobiaceae bacterium]
MSDFLYSAVRQPEGRLRGILADQLDAVTSEYIELHGDWGSLAVATCPHDEHVLHRVDGFISVLLGQPIVTSARAARGVGGLGRREAVHELARDEFTERLAWDDHLDGPFALFLMDEASGTGGFATDLMASIPLFSTGVDSQDGPDFVLGSHVDAVAITAGRHNEIDTVAALDFVIHGSITFPHTLYPAVAQVEPAAAWTFDSRTGRIGPFNRYWIPNERELFSTIRDAAMALREAIANDLAAVCDGLDTVGILLSAGEDSRVVLGAIPPGPLVKAFIFADRENREVEVTRRVAAAYGARFVMGTRHQHHYLAALETTSSMVGSQHRFIDVHGAGFHKELGLDQLPVVLGGFSSDTLLKAQYATARLPKGQNAWKRGTSDGIAIPALPGVKSDLLDEVAARREGWRERLAPYRPDSAGEWLNLWPFSMRRASGNFPGNRRLFRTHEPFMSNPVVKIAAAVPQKWKMNRRLFHIAMRPYLERSWNIPHGRSLYPYFGFYSNLALGAGVRFARSVRARINATSGDHHGPWPDRKVEVRSELMAEKRARYPVHGTALEAMFDTDLSDGWVPNQQLLLLELAFIVHHPRDNGGS